MSTVDDKNNKDAKQIKGTSILPLVEKKKYFFNDIIQQTILNIQKNKMFDILGVSDINSCIHSLNSIQEKLVKLSSNNNTDMIVNNLQTINNELSGVLKNYGTESLEDLLMICFGSNILIMNTEDEVCKFDLLKKFFHPTGYKVIHAKKDDESSSKKKPVPVPVTVMVTTAVEDSSISDSSENLNCSDISISVKPFHSKVYGMKVFIRHTTLKKSLLVYGIVDDIMIHFLENEYINRKMKEIRENLPKEVEFHSESFSRFVVSLSLKDLLICNHTEIYGKYVGYLSQYKLFKHKTLNLIVKEFVTSDLFTKRTILMQLLVNSDTYENKYLAYLLYDLLSNDVNGTVDTQEQIILFDSFTWPIKEYFRDAMKKTVQYTNDLSNFDINKIPLEQQICLLKANDNVKEKAMLKLKEIKSKTEDSGSKARQYLDGLLKIPFSIYKKEPILSVLDEIRFSFNELRNQDKIKEKYSIAEKERYTSIEIIHHLREIKDKVYSNAVSDVSVIKKSLLAMDKKKLVNTINELNNSTSIQDCALTVPQLVKTTGKNKVVLKDEIFAFIDMLYKDSVKYKTVIQQLYALTCLSSSSSSPSCSSSSSLSLPPSVPVINNTAMTKIDTKLKYIQDYIGNVKKTLDEAVHGHDKAKEQVERIIGQWINGEQDGYCFGFEGPPGVGKTSLAKRGLSNCLKDENNVSRPFAFIQIGGDSNGSTLHGHNYTYVGSTWGSITQIIMDHKCMNPIIFIDEVDKISRTEHGREIIGILTHLLDPTQNDSFQDKYFNGIDLDLSKALFILSYNDPEAIDKILLDRIHRVRFNNLTLDEKLTIAKLHMLPEVYNKMGLNEMIVMDDTTIKYIIENYTCEAGVRKLKEKLFEIVGEINIDILKNNGQYKEFPVQITIEDIKTKYFKDKQEVIIKKISGINKVGIANGMWANSAGQGGTLPITAKFFPCETFLELKLTGMQEKVMQESMHVAETVAWELTDEKTRMELIEKYNGNHKYGIHIHTGDGSVTKDGPSGGAAITTVVYSVLNNRKIKNHFALTGEIDLNGDVTSPCRARCTCVCRIL